MYRPNVCVVLTNKKRNKVLMFHRVDGRKKAWQFPQGGVDAGETENEAMLRELKEEIGTNGIERLKVAKRRVKYKFPSWIRKEFRQRQSKIAKYKGQKQRWYLAHLKDGVEAISFTQQPAEFDAFEWVSVKKALKRIVPFKRKAYKKGLKLLGMLD